MDETKRHMLLEVEMESISEVFDIIVEYLTTSMIIILLIPGNLSISSAQDKTVACCTVPGADEHYNCNLTVEWEIIDLAHVLHVPTVSSNGQIRRIYCSTIISIIISIWHWTFIGLFHMTN